MKLTIAASKNIFLLFKRITQTEGAKVLLEKISGEPTSSTMGMLVPKGAESGPLKMLMQSIGVPCSQKKKLCGGFE